MNGPGLVIGKFLPPHAGHHLVIDRALDECRRVDVLVCDLPGQAPEAGVRMGWLAEIHKSAEVGLVDDICGWHRGSRCLAACSSRWAAHLLEHGLGPWDAVYGSEPYVSSFAHALAATAVLVDPGRGARPVSGTSVRADLAANWQWLHPLVRAGLTRRVVVVGAESTGTTTLARDLASELSVPLVLEYGREFSEERARSAGSIWEVRWESDDFTHIADRQQALETKVIDAWVADPQSSVPRRLGPLVVCDTDILATAVWHQRYCGVLREDLIERSRARPPLLYILTTPVGVPFEQDGLRDGEHLREEMTDWFRDVLRLETTPWMEVQGDRAERVSQALVELDRLNLHPLVRDAVG